MVELGDLLKGIRELIEVSKRVEDNTRDIAGIKEELKELRKGQEATLKKVGSLGNSMRNLEKTIDTRLAAI